MMWIPIMYIHGYTPGYLNSYIYGPTVVYGTGFYYAPWYGAYYYPRPWSWGFNFCYTPYFGWGFGWGYSPAWFSIGFGFGYGYGLWIWIPVVVAGGVLHFITPPAGVDGMEAQGLMASMEIISMYIIISMLITRTMYIGAGRGVSSQSYNRAGGIASRTMNYNRPTTNSANRW